MKHNLIIIGGGPAGMMAAISASHNVSDKNYKILILEKNKSLGKKLLITGKSRCNITNDERNLRAFIDQLGNSQGKNGNFFYSALSQFTVENVIDFFENNQLKTKVERGMRVFPESNNAKDVLQVLEKELHKKNISIQYNCEVIDFKQVDNNITSIITKKSTYTSDKIILATGGLSYPNTGSTGDGYKLAKKLGHTIIKTQPALIGLILNESYLKSIAGISLKNINISVFQNNKKQDERFGEALFTHVGISGPIILDMSKNISRLLKQGDVILSINFKPALDYQTLDRRIIKDLTEMNNKTFQYAFDKLLPKKLRALFVTLSKIDLTKKANEITKKERKIIVNLLSNFKLKVSKLESIEKAIITTGGIDLKEIDSKTMQSKLINNLYFAGEIIDLDGPTGGYNLQICWSTGYTAGFFKIL